MTPTPPGAKLFTYYTYRVTTSILGHRSFCSYTLLFNLSVLATQIIMASASHRLRKRDKHNDHDNKDDAIERDKSKSKDKKKDNEKKKKHKDTTTTAFLPDSTKSDGDSHATLSYYPGGQVPTSAVGPVTITVIVVLVLATCFILYCARIRRALSKQKRTSTINGWKLFTSGTGLPPSEPENNNTCQPRNNVNIQ